MCLCAGGESPGEPPNLSERREQVPPPQVSGEQHRDPQELSEQLWELSIFLTCSQQRPPNQLWHFPAVLLQVVET